jgi:cell division protein FtsB
MRGVKTSRGGGWKRAGAFLVLLIVFGVLLNSVRNVYKKKVGAEKALSQVQSEIKDLEDRQKFLTESLARLDTQEGLKFEIRKKLNVAEAGESVAIVVDEETSSSTPPSSISSWQKLKNFFTGLFE